MKGKVVKGLLVCMMTFSLALGTQAGGSVFAASEETAEAVSGDAAVARSVIGDYEVAVVGAEQVNDSDGNPALRIYYDFTNHSQYLASAYNQLSIKITEDGNECSVAYISSDEEIEESSNVDLLVRPEKTLRCIREVKFDPNGKDIELTFEAAHTDNPGTPWTLTLDAQDLSGAPSDEFVLEPETDPVWLADAPSAGMTADGKYEISIDKMERLRKRYVRIYYTWTNHTGETATATTPGITVFQDGVSCPEYHYYEEIESDSASSEEVADGDSIQISKVFKFRTNSPLEAQVVSFYRDENVIGVRYDLN